MLLQIIPPFGLCVSLDATAAVLPTPRATPGAALLAAAISSGERRWKKPRRVVVVDIGPIGGTDGGWPADFVAAHVSPVAADVALISAAAAATLPRPRAARFSATARSTVSKVLVELMSVGLDMSDFLTDGARQRLDPAPTMPGRSPGARTGKVKEELFGTPGGAEGGAAGGAAGATAGGAVGGAARGDGMCALTA